jgi:hypothetical protein
MTRTLRVFGVAALVLALFAIAGPGAAGAKKKKVHGSLTIAHEKNAVSGDDRFYGVVSSPNPRCARGALVNLGFRPAFEGGGGSDIPRVTVASDRADGQGNWEILFKVTPNPAYDFQSYSADSPKRVLKTNKPGVKLVCKFAASRVITLFPG